MANRRLVSSIGINLDVGRSGAKSVQGVSKLVSSGASMVPEGHIFVNLGQTLSTKLCEDENLALEEIHYCQEGLNSVRINSKGDEHGQEIVSPAQGEQMRKKKDLINHDYLVLKLRPGDPNAEEVHIKAEKGPDGIHIKHIESSDVTSVLYKGVRCFTVACTKKRIRLEALLAILKEESPKYSAVFSNCWFYAQNTAKRLVKACMETPGISSAEKARLRKLHDHLLANLIIKHVKYVVLRPKLLVQQLQTVMQSLVNGSLAMSVKGKQIA